MHLAADQLSSCCERARRLCAAAAVPHAGHATLQRPLRPACLPCCSRSTPTRAVQSPGRQFLIDAPGEAPRKRIVLVRHAATASSEETRLHSDADEPCSSLGEVQAVKAAEFLMDAAIDNLFVSPAERAVYTAAAIAKCQSLTGDRAPRLQVVDALRNIEVGSYSGRLASEVRLCAPRSVRAGGNPCVCLSDC